MQEDDELRDKLLELRVNVTTCSTKKISNVVQENDKLKLQLDNAHEEIAKLRKRLLNIGTATPHNNDQPHKFTFEEVKNKVQEVEDEEEEATDEEEEEEEYDDEEEEEDDEAKSADDTKKGPPTGRHSRAASIVLQKYSNHKANKKSFMSTAPLSAFLQGGPQTVGSLKPKLKLKESKAELKQYANKLEEALAKCKQRCAEAEKDCEIMNKTVMRDMRRCERMQAGV